MSTQVKDQIHHFLQHATLSLSTFPHDIGRCMEIAEKFKHLSGNDKKKVVKEEVNSFIKEHMSNDSSTLKTVAEDSIDGIIDIIALASNNGLNINQAVTSCIGCFGKC